MSKVILSSGAPDLFPSPVYVAKVQAGATTGDVLITSSAAYELVTVPAGVHVIDVAWEVGTAFTADVDLTLGSSTDPDGWAGVDDISATTADVLPEFASRKNLVATDVSVPAFGPTGFKASAADGVYVTVNTATAATGLMDVYVYYVYAGSFMPESTRREMLERTNQPKAGIGII